MIEKEEILVEVLLSSLWIEYQRNALIPHTLILLFLKWKISRN